MINGFALYVVQNLCSFGIAQVNVVVLASEDSIPGTDSSIVGEDAATRRENN